MNISLKPSGVQWLGDIPSHWETCPIKRCVDRFYSGGTPDSGKAEFYCEPPDGYPWLMISDITNQFRVSKTKKAITEKGLHSKGLELLPPGTILFSMYASLGTVAILEVKSAVNQAILGMSPKGKILHPEFFLYHLKTIAPYLTLLSSVSTQQNLNSNKVRNLRIALPPLKEQTIITKYLNDATTKIDNAIVEKEKLLELLAEQRRAVIHHAITRGLDSSVSLKSSGVSWLGDIPSHWDTRKIGTCVDIIVSNVDKHSKEGERPIRLCNYTDVYKNDFITGDMNFMHATATYKEIKRFRIRVGDTIITKDSETWKEIGVPSYVTFEDDDLLCGYHLAILRPCAEFVYGNYLFRLLQSVCVSDQFSVTSKGVIRYSLPYIGIKNTLIPLPPIEEQITIAKYLDGIIIKTDATIASTRQEIELLREYRTRLISDTVTGKIDVCGFTLSPEPKSRKKEEYTNGQ